MSTLFEELSRVKTYEYTEEDVRGFESLHEEIRALKKERNAVIVAHNYYRPEILKVADFVGDSLELALMASKVKFSVKVVGAPEPSRSSTTSKVCTVWEPSKLVPLM